MNELVVLDRLHISYDMAGYPIVENYEVVRDTIASILDGTDKLVITADEASVDSAKAIKAQLTKAQKRLTEVFDPEKAKLNDLVMKERELKRLFERSKSYISDGLEWAKKEWVKEAIIDNERIATNEITVDMIAPSVYSRKQTKKAVKEAVRDEIERLEDEYKKLEQAKDSLKSYCESKGQLFERYEDLLERMTLAEVMMKIDNDIQLEERAKQTEVTKPVTPEPIAQSAAEEDEQADVWNIQLKMTTSQRKLLKRFLQVYGIEIVGSPVRVNELDFL